MTGVSGIYNCGDQFTPQPRKLEEAKIYERDSAAIVEFIQYQDTKRGLATGTNLNDCSNLRLYAKRELAKGTLRNYRKSLLKLFRYLDREWVEDIELGATAEREVTERRGCRFRDWSTR